MKIKNKTKQGYLEAEVGDGIDISGRMASHRGTVQKGLAQTITCAGGNNVGVVINSEIVKINKIRMLTPKECIKLMGFEEKDYNQLVKCGLSDNAIYHIAGDSIVTTVLVSIFSNLINENDTHKNIIENYVDSLVNDGNINVSK